MTVVKVIKKINFPDARWLSHNVVGPHNNRLLVEVRGHSGNSSWVEALMTFPQNAIGSKTYNPYGSFDWINYWINPGVYNIQEAQDKRGRRLLRFYTSDIEPSLILFDTHGYLVQEASSKNVISLVQCQGSSRTGKNGNRWSLIIAAPGNIVAIEPYDSYGDPIYYRVHQDSIEELGNTDAVLHPDEW